MVKIIETPRDAFQGLKQIISTNKKLEYIQELIKVGFDSVDIGSFVSHKAIPQMADTEEIVQKLDLSESKSKIMVLVVNKIGANKAACYPQIDQLIYPFSVSPTFLKKNINADFDKAERSIDDILNACGKSNKEAIIYLSMGFGNPYKDDWSLEIIHHWVRNLVDKGVKTIPISDITGVSTPRVVKLVLKSVMKEFPDTTFGLHLHAHPKDWIEKVDAAYEIGCRYYDSVLGGMGGCPLTGYELLSNLKTENLLHYLNEKGVSTKIDTEQLRKAQLLLSNLL